MIDLINAADKQDKSKGKKRWARVCELHQQREIEELERKQNLYKE